MPLTSARRFIAVAGTTLLVAACATPTAERADGREAARFPFKGGALALAQRGSDCQLTLSGEIAPPVVTALTQATNDLAKRDCRSKWLVLDATDGQVGTAVTVGSMLKNRGFNTRIRAGSTCLTPCLLVFAAGAEREIQPGTPPARLAFSQIPPDEDFGKGGCQTELDNRQMLNLARYLRAMLPGLTADYMLQQIRATDCRGVRALPAADAVTAGLATKS